MNWVRLKYSLKDVKMIDFYQSLSKVYTLAENHPEFIWRIPDNQVDAQLTSLGFDNLISSTVSTWDNLESLMDYTYNSLNSVYLKRSSEWFKKVEGPQLVIWNVENDAKPTFKEVFERLKHLKVNGSTNYAYGWGK